MLGRCFLNASRRLPAVTQTTVRGMAGQKSFVRQKQNNNNTFILVFSFFARWCTSFSQEFLFVFVVGMLRFALG